MIKINLQDTVNRNLEYYLLICLNLVILKTLVLYEKCHNLFKDLNKLKKENLIL